MLCRKPCTLSKKEEVVVEEVEEDEETTEETEMDHAVISVLRSGATGATPIPTTSRTAGRRTATATNGHEVEIKKAGPHAMDAEKWDI